MEQKDINLILEGKKTYDIITRILEYEYKRSNNKAEYESALREKEILTNPDNIFIPTISEKDSPAMRGLKQAIIEKRIDIDKYQDRFGKENFPNDKRKFKDTDITMFMMNRMNKALDIKATLILEDKSPDVPNPIGRKISIDLTGYDEE